MSEGWNETSAVVTGASSGIGRAIAVRLAAAGVSRLLVHYRSNVDGARETAAMLQSRGCQASIVAADLANAQDRRRLIDTAFERNGPLQTWVNNAGADVLTGQAESLSFEQKLLRLWEVDVTGTIQLSREVAARLARQTLPRPPSLVFISWDQACRGMEGDAGQMFGPVKAAVAAFAASLAQTVAPEIRVNTISPGWIRTSWGETTSEYWDHRARDQALMQRWGSPDDVARAVLYVADPDNTFLTAQTIDVNGGWSRRYPPEEECAEGEGR